MTIVNLSNIYNVIFFNGSKIKQSSKITEVSKFLNKGFVDFQSSVKNSIKENEGQIKALLAQVVLLRQGGNIEEVGILQEQITILKAHNASLRSEMQKGRADVEQKITALKDMNEEELNSLYPTIKSTSQEQEGAIREKSRGDKINLLGLDQEQLLRLQNFQQKYTFDDSFTKKILEKFQELSGAAEDFNAYLKCYQTCLFVAEVIENNNDGNEVFARAFKMFVMFQDDLALAQKFLNAHYLHNQNPLHDMLIGHVHSNLDLLGWRKLIKDDAGNTNIPKDFGNAKELELDGKAPKNIIEFTSRLALLFKTTDLYGQFEPEYADFAKICAQNKVFKHTFDKCIELMKDKKIIPKISDLIPNIIVSAKEAGVLGKDDYYLVKLPSGDLRGLILGHITDCCQSVGSATEFVAIDGTNLQNNTFYVLIKAKGKDFDPEHIDWQNFESNGHEIKGQGYVWRSISGSTLTFDSWENLKDETGANDAMMFDMLRCFGEKASSFHNVDRVTVGTGGKTPESLRKMPTTYPDGMMEGKQYGDSKSQVEIYRSETLKAKISENITELEKKLGIGDGVLESVIISVEQIDDIMHMYNNRDLDDIKPSSLIKILKPDVLRACKSNKIDLITLKSLDDSLCDIATNSDMVQSFLLGVMNFHTINWEQFAQDLQGIPKEIYHYIVTYEVIIHYLSNKIKFSDFFNISQELVGSLTTQEAFSCYENTGLRPSDFRDIAQNIIYNLVSHDAVRIYQETELRPLDFKGIPQNIMHNLLSQNALNIYKMTKFKPSDFEYMHPFFVWKDLDFSECDYVNLKLEDLVVPYMKIKLPEEYNFAGVPSILIPHLLTDSAIKIYQETGVYPTEFQNMRPAQIEMLTDFTALHFYKSYDLTIRDFVNIPKNQIHKLMGCGVGLICKATNLKPSDFLDLSVKEINKVTRSDMAEFYNNTNIKPLDFKDIPEDIMYYLISQDALRIYQETDLMPSDFKDIPQSVIYHLVSQDAVRIYKETNLRPSDLVDVQSCDIYKLSHIDNIEKLKNGATLQEVLEEINQAINFTTPTILDGLITVVGEATFLKVENGYLSNSVVNHCSYSLIADDFQNFIKEQHIDLARLLQEMHEHIPSVLYDAVLKNQKLLKSYATHKLSFSDFKFYMRGNIEVSEIKQKSGDPFIFIRDLSNDCESYCDGYIQHNIMLQYGCEVEGLRLKNGIVVNSCMKTFKDQPCFSYSMEAPNLLQRLFCCFQVPEDDYFDEPELVVANVENAGEFVHSDLCLIGDKIVINGGH